MALAVVVLLAFAVFERSPWALAGDTTADRVHSDFQILMAAGLAQARGLDVHDPAVLDAVGRELGRPTTPFCAAPPLVVWVFGRLGDDLDEAYTAWLVLHGLCGLVALAALVAVAGRAGFGGPAALAVGLGVVLLGDGVWMSLAMNSTNLVALAALAVALAASVRERPVVEGLALALAVVAKTSPALLVVAALFAGRRHTVVAALAGVLALTGLGVGLAGWELHVSWWERVLPALGYAPELPPGHFDNGLHQWNLAPHGLFARAAHVGGLPRTLVAAGAWVVTLLVLVQLFLTSRRGGDPAADDQARAVERVREYGLAVTASLLASSVTWPHHLVLVAFPALALLVDRASWRRPAAWLAGAACVVLALPLGTWGAEGEQPPDILAQAGACLVLFAALAALSAGDEPDAEETLTLPVG